MLDQNQSRETRHQPATRLPRIFIPGREFCSGKEFAEYLREVELMKLYERCA